MEETSHGIVLRLRPLTESSWIVSWLTLDHGRIATVAKGARQARSAFRGRLDLLVQGELTWIRSRRSELHTLREFVRSDAGLSPHWDWAQLRQIGYGTRLIELMTESDTPIPEIYDLFLGWLDAIRRFGAQPRWILALEVRLLDHLGLFADPESMPGASRKKVLLARLQSDTWEVLAAFKPVGTEVREVRKHLGVLLSHQIHRVPSERDEVLGTSRSDGLPGPESGG